MKETIEVSNLKYSYEIAFLTERIKLEAGEYKAGELVEFNNLTKTGKKLSSAEKIYGVICENITIDTETTHTEIYLQGIFNKNKIVAENISDLETIKDAARKLNIFYK